MVPTKLRREVEAEIKSGLPFPGERVKLASALESGNVELLELVLRGIRRRRDAQAKAEKEKIVRDAKQQRRLEKGIERCRRNAEINQILAANFAELENDPEWRKIMGRD